VDQSVNPVVIEISRKGGELLIAIILAGGYGTRLQTLSRNLPKPLLKVAGKPMIGYVFDKLAEVEDIGHVIISTNLRFEQQFREWLESNDNGGVEIIADGSSCEEDKPGAIASLAQIVARINDSCLIIAGDNLFTSDLRPIIRAFKDKSCVTVALYDVGNRELAKQYSTAIMDPEGRIVDFREKPDNPETTLIGTCIYILPQRTLSRLNEYVTKAADRDNPGRFIAWLCKREPVYGHVLDGYWWDIGTIDQYNEANQRVELERVLSPISLAGRRPSIRRFKDLEPVLYDGALSGNIGSEFPVYEIYKDVCSNRQRDILVKNDLRYDIVVMPPLIMGKEYVKTIGHVHLPRGDGWSHPEVYEVLAGEACFLIQRCEDGNLVDVSLVKAQTGEKVLVPSNCGHVLINASSSLLVTGNLVSRSCLRAYDEFIEHRGAAYYLLEGGRVVRNDNYSSVPSIRVITGPTFSIAGKDSALLVSFLKNPQSLDFLNHPDKIEQNEAKNQNLGAELTVESPAENF